MDQPENISVEVRGFGDLQKIFRERGWPVPLQVVIKGEMSAGELALFIDLPLDKIEAVFVNGKAYGTGHPVKPGDRVSFVPPGTPGPYRVLLGFVNKPGKNK